MAKRFDSSCERFGTPFRNYNKYTCVCSGCGGILRLRKELLGTIRGSNGFYIKDPDREKYFYDIVGNIQDVATKFWVQGAQVWIPDAELVWKSATLIENYKDGLKKLGLKYDDENEEHIVSLKSKDDLPPLRNPDILVGENDLTSLSYLHEPAVLYNLQVRFCDRNDIYTYCGIVLVAINPYQYMPIYDVDTIQAYSGQDMATMDPHIFAVAEDAFKQMAGFDENQSIIVSGESGAGKTVSAKYAMRYFATVGGAEAETQIEKKVLASNPIMEAIGNAKTTRNDNSSRFGKFLEIGFCKQNTIVGANMRTYLLEKSRVVFQASEERNYHIFYQLCASADLPELKHLQLDHPDTYMYTNQGEAPVIDGVNDAEDFEETREAFTLLGINKAKQLELFRIIAGILHMGNVQFNEEDGETCSIPKSDEYLPLMTEVFGVEKEQMRMWLCNRKIITAQESVVKPLTIQQAMVARDALAKHIYSRLFKWIVDGVNRALIATGHKTKFIGVLDIYGFETFEINSFEQFCINYANEKLQQQFCLHVFKLEQEEYVREEIEWSFIDFYDNQPCIDLIEGKLGILDLLDEECKMPKGSEANWVQKLYDKHTKSKHFSKPRMSRTSFIIHHFADNVEYQMDGFLEKNRDTILEEQINLFKASQYELVGELFAETADGPGPSKRQRGVVVRAAKQQPKGGAAQKSHKKTVGSQFRDSLNLLMDTLFSTTPHYIRCIKPNDEKAAFTFEPKRAIQQLRACGVLETIRISAAGYPSRWTYAEFFQRYRVLAKSKDINRQNMKKTCENILVKLIEDQDKYQFGKSKIFFRAGQVAYLEKLRSDRLRACGVMVQKHIRGWLAKNRYQKIRKTVLLVQTRGRGMLARRKALQLRQTHAATVIQSSWRAHYVRQDYLRKFHAVKVIQAYARGMIGRREFTKIHKESRTIIIQAAIRSYIAKKKYQKVMRGIVKLQGHVRRKAAKKQLKQLRIEARSIEGVKKQAKGLEMKIIELQQKLDLRHQEIAVLREDKKHLNELQNEMEKLKISETKNKSEAQKVPDLEALIKKLQEDLRTERKEKEEVTAEKDRMKQEKDTIIQKLLEDKKTAKEELDQANEKIKAQQKEKEDLMKQRLDENNQQLAKDLDVERSHHQRLVKEHGRLQQRFENLKSELDIVSPTGEMSMPIPGHHRTPSGISNISLDSVGSTATLEAKHEDDDSDLGYGSGRKKQQDNKEAVNNVDFAKQNELAKNAPLDIGLVTRLQSRIKELEREKKLLQREVDLRDELHGVGDRLGGQSLVETEREIYETIKMQELEMENSKLKEEMHKILMNLASNEDFNENAQASPAARQFIGQFDAMKDELERRRDECIQLRTMLSARSRGMSDIADESYGGNPNILNEDGELEMAYKTQKDLNKLLETELQRVQQSSDFREKELREQIGELKNDNDRQQKLIGQAFVPNKGDPKLNEITSNLTLGPEAKIEATMQHEITRLTSENLDLREQIDKQQEQIKKLKKALKIYAKRLKSTEASDIQAELEREMAVEMGMPTVKHHQQREYAGMFEYRKEDEPLLVRNLIIDLKPRLASSQLPGMPSYIMFMCIRHTDYLNDDEKVRSLLTNTINSIKKVVKKKQDDVETITLWLANTCRLLHNLKQYSGEKQFQQDNTTKQNEHCLRNFDLSEYRQILSDLAVWIYQGLIKLMESQIHPTVVGAVLEHEAIAGLSAAVKPSGMRARTKSTSDPTGGKEQALDNLIRSLNNFMRVLNVHAVDPELVKQIFRQLFYFVCANALNNLLLRKDMCHWSKGMQIRYNMSHLEQWIRDNKLQESDCGTALEPIVQASQLLQARKTETDVDSIVEMCSKLTTSQIIKMLNLYTPVNEFEERVPISFIRKIQEKLQARKDPSQTLLMDTKFLYAVTFPFNPSSLGLETIVPPQEWGLGFLKRL